MKNLTITLDRQFFEDLKRFMPEHPKPFGSKRKPKPRLQPKGVWFSRTQGQYIKKQNMDSEFYKCGRV